MRADPWIFATAAASLAAVLAIGIWSGRRTRTAKDFFIAGQGIGLWTAAMATMSAAFSGFVFLGGPGLTYRIGIASLFIVLPVGFTAALLCWVVARPLRRLAGAREVYTIPDALACRFSSRSTTGLGALAVVVGTVGYLGAQLLALGILLQGVLGLGAGEPGLVLGLGIGTAVVLTYSVAGGMKAGVLTDLLQGALMLAAAVAVFVQALTVAGGPDEIVRSIAGSEAFRGFFDPFGRVSASQALGFFFLFGVGVLGQPQMLHKFYMLKRVRDLRWLPAVLGGSQAACLLLWVGVGLAVPALVAQGRMEPLVRPDDATPRFLIEFAPRGLAGVAMAGALAAIMSTADSFLNIGSAVLARDLPRLLGRPLRRELLWGRWATLAIALSAAALALAYGDLVALLGTFAFGTLGAALAPAFAVGLNWRRVSSIAASASIATGLGLTLLLELAARHPATAALVPDAPAAAVALAASFTVLFAVSWLAGDRAEREMSPEVLAIVEGR